MAPRCAEGWFLIRKYPDGGVGGVEREAEISRDVLPIPYRQPVGLTTYDAKDPDSEYPPIRQLRPPDQRTECRCGASG
jgi:hypothetical protein